jgi:hypothetical protein
VFEDRELAGALLQRLAPLADRIHSWSPLAMVAERPVTHALGMLAALLRRFDDAVAWLEDAHRACTAMRASPHRARIEVDLAEVLRTRDVDGDRDRAQRLLRAAKKTADALPLPVLGARIERVLAASNAAGRVVPMPASATPSATPISMCREGDVWMIAGTKAFRLKNSRGLQILSRLVAEPGREMHVVDLMAPDGEMGLATDAGEVLDATAIAAYRRRLEAMREDEREAEAFGDWGRQQRAQAEIEALANELAGAVGLGGRSRKARSSAEKARINVRQRLKHAMDKIAEQDPDLGRHLRWAVRTGAFCAYDPGRA